MNDNAVEHYWHLLAQGVSRDNALMHTRLRYGVSREALVARVNGLVANPTETREALAEVKAYLTKESAQADRLLSNLYVAITGETV